MIIKSATFVCSSPTVDSCPPPVYPEYAFCGRSNVGKSSLINMMCNISGLAKTSSTPGKTRLINHFMVNESWYLADLPGYGYAKVAKESKAGWPEMTMQYLLKRENLMCLFLLVDSRHELQEIDSGFMEFLGESEIPFVLVFTKTDKLTKNELHSNMTRYKKQLIVEWEPLPTMILTSASEKKGRDELLTFIEEANKDFKIVR